MHYFQFNIGDYASHTRHLTQTEDLGYRRLLDHYYLTEKPLELDAKKLARLIGMRDNAGEIEQVLADFFVKTDDGYTQNRVSEEIAKYHSKADAARANGKKGGRPQKPKITQPVNSANPAESGSEAKQETLTTKQETLTSSDVVTVSAKPKPRAKFSQPDLMEVYEYLSTRGIDQATARIESEKFTDYYSSNGWKVGKNSMKCWKAAARNWTKNIATTGATHGQQARHQQPKPSLVDRVKQQAEQRLRDQEASAGGHREFSVDPMAQADRNVRVQVCEPVRGDSRGDVDNVLNGDYWPTNG